MGYVLINGKRYYQDTAGNILLDNVSQEEADRRERRNVGSKMVRSRSSSGASHYSQRRRNRIAPAACRAVPWGAIITIMVLIMLVGAFVYNQSHVSYAEKVICSYMDNAEEELNIVTEDITESIKKRSSGETDIVREVLESDYILSDSDERYLETYEIENCSHSEIQLMINEIYARHGREFHSQENIDYFSKLGWYVPISGKTDEEIVREFNEFEKANVDLLSMQL